MGRLCCCSTRTYARHQSDELLSAARQIRRPDLGYECNSSIWAGRLVPNRATSYELTPLNSSRNWCLSRQSSNKLERLSRRSTGGRRQVRRGTSDRRMYRSWTISTGLSDRCVSLSMSSISVVDYRRLRHKEYKTWLEERSLYKWYTNRQLQ